MTTITKISLSNIIFYNVFQTNVNTYSNENSFHKKSFGCMILTWLSLITVLVRSLIEARSGNQSIGIYFCTCVICIKLGICDPALCYE